MTVITLIRHGQANFGAKSEEDYDRLSDLGHQQSKWLGEYLKSTNEPFDFIHCGTLRRHLETSDGMEMGPATQDARLNEMRYIPMAEAFNAETGMAMPKSGAEFAAHVPHLFRAWESGNLDHVHTPYHDFGQQMADVVTEALATGGRHLFVTSGGVIGMMIARIMGMSSEGFARMMLPIRNTSIHQFGIEDGSIYLDSYNKTPHLDHADRAFARTFV